MLFLMDENVDHAVGVLLAATHDVRHTDQEVGPGQPDPVVERYARAEGCTVVTGDRSFALRLRSEARRLPCLWLHDLVTEERSRVATLLDVIEREWVLTGDRFWMEIRATRFTVER